jgi:hypothetical protein
MRSLFAAQHVFTASGLLFSPANLRSRLTPRVSLCRPTSTWSLPTSRRRSSPALQVWFPLFLNILHSPGFTLFLFPHRQFHVRHRPELDFGHKQSTRDILGLSRGTEATQGNMHLRQSQRFEILPTKGLFSF